MFRVADTHNQDRHPCECVVGVENPSIPNTNASIPHHMYAFGIIRSFKVPNPIRIPFLHKSMLSRLGHLHVMLERRWQYLGLAMHPRKPTTLPGIRESQPSLKSRGSRTSKPDHKLRVSFVVASRKPWASVKRSTNNLCMWAGCSTTKPSVTWFLHFMSFQLG